MAGFVTTRSNVILLGPPGTGKTHLATALAIRGRVGRAAASTRADNAASRA
jgi:ATP-dependent protease Clp ATPase subunit